MSAQTAQMVSLRPLQLAPLVVVVVVEGSGHHLHHLSSLQKVVEAVLKLELLKGGVNS